MLYIPENTDKTANPVLAIGSKEKSLSIIQVLCKYGRTVEYIISPFFMIFLAREGACLEVKIVSLSDNC